MKRYHVSPNLFNPSATDTTNGYIDGYRLNQTTEEESGGCAISEYIPIEPGSWYTVIGTARAGQYNASIAYYTSEKEAISGAKYGGNDIFRYQAPANAAYLRFTIIKANISIIMLLKGSYTSETLPDYEPYGSEWQTKSPPKYGTAIEAIQSGDTIYADGQPITTYNIKGNEEHTGTPTPSNPVEVNGVGVRTENLWGETSTTNQYIDNQGNTGTNPNGDVYSLKTFTVSPSTTYTFSWSGFTVGNDNNLPYIRICFYTSNGGTFISRTLVNPNDYLDKYVSFTIPNNCTYVDIRIDSEASTRGQHFDNLMLNTGSTAKPYEPYGYKIPISSGGVTTNIYLGSTQTVRQIKKLVLTGDENFDYYSVAQGSLFRLTLNNSPVKSQLSEMARCSHYEVVIATNRTNMTLSGILTVGSNVTTMDFINNDYNNATEFKAHLADQYAAGTPVTVWYVLATPETATVNEPLMKIGIYADTLSNATSIPTTEGANTITVDTTVQPSEFTATWTGWHDSSVQEYVGGVGLNKFDEQYPDIKFDVIYRPLYVGSGEFTCTSTCPQSQYGAQLFILAGNVSSGASTNTNGVWNGTVRSVTAVDGYVTIVYRNAGGVSPSDYETMLNAGSTALPYEPYEYGWK